MTALALTDFYLPPRHQFNRISSRSRWRAPFWGVEYSGSVDVWWRTGSRCPTSNGPPSWSSQNIN